VHRREPIISIAFLDGEVETMVEEHVMVMCSGKMCCTGNILEVAWEIAAGGATIERRFSAFSGPAFFINTTSSQSTH
jgi:hypothetical protein